MFIDQSAELLEDRIADLETELNGAWEVIESLQDELDSLKEEPRIQFVPYPVYQPPVYIYQQPYIPTWGPKITWCGDSGGLQITGIAISSGDNCITEI